MPLSNTRSTTATTSRTSRRTRSHSAPGITTTAARKNFICIANAPASLSFSFRFTPEVEPMAVSAFQSAYDELKKLGLILHRAPGEYRVSFPHGAPGTEYITDDLQDALSRGRDMAEQPPPQQPPPLGPMGRRTRKGEMYKHNRKVAARRRRRQDRQRRTSD
jgi:hypothetical protein